MTVRNLAATGPPPERILIVMLSAVGDAVHVLPIANALKRQWPSCSITWVIQSLPHRLVEGHPAIDEFLVFERGRGMAGWEGFQKLALEYPQQPYDLALGLQVYFKAGLLLHLAPADVKLGFDTARARDLNWLFTSERIDARGVRHVQDQYFEFLEHLGIAPHPVEWGIPISDPEREAQERFFADRSGPVCAIVVGTSKPRKNWTAEGYARVSEHLSSRWGVTPVLVGGPSASERLIADEVIRRSAVEVVDCLGDDLRKLVWLIDGSDLVISPDTGPLHVARALETPVVGLYGYTNPKRTGPYRKYHELLVDGYAEFPGEAYPVSSQYRDGMKRVTVERVVEKIDAAMETHVGGRASP